MDFNEGKVSIIIPSHNSEEFLDECIESALNQTYPDIEVIVVDDGSTDNSLKLLQKYLDKIKIITVKNCSVGAAYNHGIKIAKGEWIKPLDSDDVLNPNGVGDLISVGKKICDKKNTMLYGYFDHIDSTSKIIDKKIEQNNNHLKIFDFNIILLDHMFGFHGSSLIHKSTIQEYGLFDESIPNEVDYELWLRYCILHNCRLHLVPKTIAKYRMHANQLTITTRKKKLELEDKIRNSVLEKCDPNDRILYEQSLSDYKKNMSFKLKILSFVRDYFIVRFSPNVIIKIKIFCYSEKRIIRKFFKF